MVENFPKSVKILTTVLRLQKIPSKIITKHTLTHRQTCINIISDKLDLKTRNNTMVKKEYYIMKKDSTHQKNHKNSKYVDT